MVPGSYTTENPRKYKQGMIDNSMNDDENSVSFEDDAIWNNHRYLPFYYNSLVL